MSSNADRLAEAVRQRRALLEMTQLEVSAAGGPSNTWQTQLEKGDVALLTRATARKLDAGLQWVPGSARNVWNGGKAEPLEDAGLSPVQMAELNMLSPELREHVLRALSRNPEPTPDPEPQREGGEAG